MKKLVLVALALLVFTPVVATQTATPFAGVWEGNYHLQRPDGTEGDPSPILFNLTQKGRVLTGTAGPPASQQKVDKGEVTSGKATFEVQPPDGPLFRFTLTIVKGRLQGEMTGERDGVLRGRARVDAAKTK
jgi:hypothetical protein